MPRKKNVAAEQNPTSQISPSANVEGSTISEPVGDIPSFELPTREAPVTNAAETSQESGAKGTWVSKLPEPHGRHGIDLGDGRRLVLSLNRRFNQNMIQFVPTSEGVDPRPSTEDTEFLKANGWRWRSEEKAWTRQLDKNTDEHHFARAKSDRQAEDQFVTLANAIRERNGLEPTSYDFGREIAIAR